MVASDRHAGFRRALSQDFRVLTFPAGAPVEAQATTHDRNLFHRLLKQISPDGQVIDWLKNNFMLKALPVRHFENVEELAKSLSLEVIEFDDKEANDRYSDLRRAVDNFCSKISYHTWRDNGNWLEVPTEWADRDHDKYNAAISAIAEARNAFVEAYDGFLLACHQKAIDGDGQPKDGLRLS